jgi:hypothetical protein
LGRLGFSKNQTGHCESRKRIALAVRVFRNILWKKPASAAGTLAAGNMAARRKPAERRQKCSFASRSNRRLLA